MKYIFFLVILAYQTHPSKAVQPLCPEVGQTQTIHKGFFKVNDTHSCPSKLSACVEPSLCSNNAEAEPNPHYCTDGRTVIYISGFRSVTKMYSCPQYQRVCIKESLCRDIALLNQPSPCNDGEPDKRITNYFKIDAYHSCPQYQHGCINYNHCQEY